MSALICEKMYKYTENEIRFCDGIVLKGMSQREAYLYAGYSNQKGDMGKVDVKASQLASKDKVRERIEQLRDKKQAESIKNAIWEKDDSIRELKALIDNAKEIERLHIKYRAKIIQDSIRELNSMFGYNKQNIDMNGHLVGDFEIKIQEE